MVVVKLSEKLEGLGDRIVASLCGEISKEEDGYIAPWLGRYTYSNIKYFTCSNNDNYWIVPGNLYNRWFNNWKGPIHNVRFLSQTLKEKSKVENTCTKYAGSAKFNVVPMK